MIKNVRKNNVFYIIKLFIVKTMEENEKVDNVYYYSEMLLNGVPNKHEAKIQDIPLVINTIDASYPLAFIDYEESDLLGINYTVEDGTEHFVVINKKHIVDVQILYEQDISIFLEEPEEEYNDMYQ